MATRRLKSSCTIYGAHKFFDILLFFMPDESGNYSFTTKSLKEEDKGEGVIRG